jgi:hypothetical protein
MSQNTAVFNRAPPGAGAACAFGGADALFGAGLVFSCATFGVFFGPEGDGDDEGFSAGCDAASLLGSGCAYLQDAF